MNFFKILFPWNYSTITSYLKVKTSCSMPSACHQGQESWILLQSISVSILGMKTINCQKLISLTTFFRYCIFLKHILNETYILTGNVNEIYFEMEDSIFGHLYEPVLRRSITSVSIYVVNILTLYVLCVFDVKYRAIERWEEQMELVLLQAISLTTNLVCLFLVSDCSSK